MKAVNRILSLIFGVNLLCAHTVGAQEQAPSSLTAEYVFTIEAGISAPLVMGPTTDGERQAIPITGGSVYGAGIKGEVVPGGADYQVLLSDGSRRIKAVYMIKTDDGALINVENEGVIISPPAGSQQQSYFRTSPRFKAPTGKYDWLNQAIFVCGVRFDQSKPGIVIIDVYKLL